MSWLCDANSERTQIPSQRLLTSLEPNRCFLTHLRCRGAHKGTYHTNGPSYPLQGRQIIQITKGLLDTISYKQNALPTRAPPCAASSARIDPSTRLAQVRRSASPQAASAGQALVLPTHGMNAPKVDGHPQILKLVGTPRLVTSQN